MRSVGPIGAGHLQLAVLLGLALTVAPALTPRTARAAQVSGVARGGRVEIYLKLSATDAVKAGQALRASNGARLRVLERFGRRARATLIGGSIPRRGTRVRAPQLNKTREKTTLARATAKPPLNASANATHDTNWTVGSPSVGQRVGVLPATAWQTLRAKPRSLIGHVSGASASEGVGRTKGDFAFVGIGLLDVKGVKSWTFATLRSRLDMPSIGGTPLSWSHDLTLRYDGISPAVGRGQGGARARNPVVVRQARLGWRAGWGSLGAGRLVMATGATGRLIDGVSAHLSAGQWGTVSVWGGTAADPVSLALQLDTGRFGLGWRGARRKGALLTQWSLGYAAQVVEGKLDPHRADASVRLAHDRRGEVNAAATLSIGRPDLSGTALAAAITPGVALARLWLSAATQRSATGWLYRARYSYHRPTLDRLLARTLPWDVWVDGKSHLLSISADRAASQGWWIRPALNLAWLNSPEPYDGLRAAASVRGGLRGRRWSPHAALHVESGLAFTALGEAAGPSRGIGGWLGTGYRLSRAWRLDGRVGVRYDELLPVRNGALRLRNSASIEWLKNKWIVALQVGGDTLLSADPTPGSYKLNWVDATLLIRRRL